MLKRPITYTYTNDEDKEVTETEVFYFHLSAREIAELDLAHNEDSFEDWFKKAVEKNDRKALYEFFKEIILLSYGERSEDGKVFKKSPEIREKFASHAAYEALFDEFYASDEAMFAFFKGALPSTMSENWDKAIAEAKAELKPAES